MSPAEAGMEAEFQHTDTKVRRDLLTASATQKADEEAFSHHEEILVVPVTHGSSRDV